MSADGFDFRPIDLSPEGIAETIELLRVVFPNAHHIDDRYLERLYFGNPLGESFGSSCFDANGKLVAHNIMIPIKAQVFGREEVGIWPFQLATHPEARLKGLFVAITEHTMRECRERGFEWWAGVGNQNSSPIFVKKWNFQNIGQLQVKIGLGPVPASKPLDGVQYRRIWEGAELTAWRLGHSPHAPYRYVLRGDTAHIFADSGRAGIPVEIGAVPKSHLPQDLSPLGPTHPLRLWVGWDPTRNWSRSAYFDLPKRFWPSPLNMLWYDLTGRDRRFDVDRVQYDVMNFDAW